MAARKGRSARKSTCAVQFRRYFDCVPQYGCFSAVEESIEKGVNLRVMYNSSRAGALFSQTLAGMALRRAINRA
jgi:hypothetical protein